MIDSLRKLYRYYHHLGLQAMKQIPDEHLFEQPNEVSNSISLIVKHLHGNMLSRWTDFLHSDGEKEWRQRDDEFEDTFTTREEVNTAYAKGWQCVFDAIDPLTDEDLSRIVYIRNEGHTVLEAIHRQLGHYAYHIGQIVYLARMWKGNDWESLSIPKGASKAFNARKFEAQKEQKHFTDGLMKDE